MDPKTAAPQKGVFTVIKQIDPTDNYTVKISLHKPHATLPAAFASLRGSAMPNKETVEQHGGELATQAVGTGPFKLAEVVSADYVRYVRNPDYWDRQLPLLDEFTLKLMVDEDQRVAALRSGQIDLAPVSAVGAQRLASEQSITVLRSPKAALFMVMIESMKKPFDDARVRKAMSMALDRKAIIQKAAQGAGVLSGPVPTGHSDWYIPEERLPYKQDIEGAKKLLAEAGHPDGFKTSIRTLAHPEWVGCAVELKNQLQAIGIDVTVEQLEQGQMGRSANIGGDPNKPSEYELQLATFSFYPDPDAYIGQLMPERNVVTRGGNTALKDDYITDLLDKAEATTNHEERKKLYLDAQMRFLNDLVPALYLYAGVQIDGVSNRLKNYKQSFLSRRLLIKYASVG
jgi:ABC-type transport system substrate-binding protein